MNILSFSGGKDSTAMLLRLIEIGTPPDRIVFFDGGWEFPQMAAHIERVKTKIHPLEIESVYPTREGRKVSFEYLMSTYVKTKGTAKGTTGYGWPSHNRRWCTAEKTGAIRRFVRQFKLPTEFIGIASDEAHRAKKPHTRYPLIEWGWTEADCLQYCYSKGLEWEGLYNHFKRVSCWCCPLSMNNELRNLYRHFPELWAHLEQMQDKVDCNCIQGKWFKRNIKKYTDTVGGWTQRFSDETQEEGTE